MARLDWETPPTVEGIITKASIAQEGADLTIDTMVVKGIDVADNIENLLHVIGDSSSFSLVGKMGIFARHGYSKAEDLIGKKCLLYSNNSRDAVAIESPSFDGDWSLMTWTKYID